MKFLETYSNRMQTAFDPQFMTEHLEFYNACIKEVLWQLGYGVLSYAMFFIVYVVFG